MFQNSVSKLIVSAVEKWHRAGRFGSAPIEGLGRGDAGGGTPSEGSGGTPPVGGDAVALYIQTLNSSWHKPHGRGRIELAPNAPALGRNAAVVPSSSVKTIPRAGSVGSTASPNAWPTLPAGDSADKLSLRIESVKRDTKHMWSSTAQAPVDGAEGSLMF